MSETLREIAIDFARRLAACEANRAFSGLDAWEHSGEYLAEYMERINAANQERTCRMDDMVTGEYADYECWEHITCIAVRAITSSALFNTTITVMSG